MMAQLRGTPASSAPAKLFDTNRETWVTADDVARLRSLRAAYESSGEHRDWQVLHAFCSLAKGWQGTEGELLDAWAERRRLDATYDWRQTVPPEIARSQGFPPYTDAWIAGL